MRYTKKLIKTSGGLVVRVPSDIVKVLNLTEKDYVEIDLNKIDVKALSGGNEVSAELKNKKFLSNKKSK
ncbi:hypothetical protein HYX04_03500 [Candidatus Woesearchaeota archaeon]|nr:hypothetical protein [Candidatus Woesearchaeota archaeon]